MGTYKILWTLSLAALTLAACDDLADRDYYSNTTTLNENEQIRSVKESSEAYIKSRADLSEMDKLFANNGIYDKLNSKSQLHTLLVVTNDNFTAPQADKAEFIANSHVTDIAVSPSKLEEGNRLLMWHNKYVSVSLDEDARKGNIIDHIQLNNALLKEVINTQDGFIYVISEMINTPQALQDYINELDDTQYGIFKDMVLSSGGKVFDKNNSKPVGIDDAGNTVYDSVFIYTNEFFDAKNFDLSSEALKATMLVFSDDVIKQALGTADSALRAWGQRDEVRDARPDDVLKRWILETAFFNQTYTAEDMNGEEQLTSIYNRTWLPSAQNVDVEHPKQLSNGIAYNVKQLHIPTNVLIYRLKECFHYYEYCTAEQKAEYFKCSNLTFSKCDTEVADWTPLAGVWPLHHNRVLIMDLTDKENKTFAVDYVMNDTVANDAGGYDVRPMLVPPGTYRFALGFKQNMDVDLKVELGTTINGEFTPFENASSTISTGSASGTLYHYDRGTGMSHTWAEGYEEAMSSLTNSKAKNYDTDGGIVLPEVEIPASDDKGSPTQVTIRITCANTGDKTTFTFHHWCLRPTSNNY